VFDSGNLVTMTVSDYISNHFGYEVRLAIGSLALIPPLFVATQDGLADSGYWAAIGYLVLFQGVVRVLVTIGMAKVSHIKR
jgi:hypothetical protein